MSISAMKCALQSLESVERMNGWNRNSITGKHCSQSIHFLRQAIEQSEGAVAAEREACAKVCETFYNHEAKDCAEAIRARGSEK
jgi:hypothetical protein